MDVIGDQKILLTLALNMQTASREQQNYLVFRDYTRTIAREKLKREMVFARPNRMIQGGRSLLLLTMRSRKWRRRNVLAGSLLPGKFVADPLGCFLLLPTKMLQIEIAKLTKSD